eukprot:TRINITY_DN26904_c0_g1_i2.p2 TRINITY_DN26904_c0_g1~~TRINITY_DN26904_c0_g1_i2.p2  ORF type:complete len:177 (+),score=43.15 TRINITY_DN26904_c0_g1_i2:1-531(+)
MDNLSSWGHESLKGWRKQASALQTKSVTKQQACVAEEIKRRAQVQNKLASICEDMCKEVGAYPKCNQCPAVVAPDATPGVMTWDELLEHMDNLSSWGHESLKGWRKQASALQTKSVTKQQACVAEEIKRRAQPRVSQGLAQAGLSAPDQERYQAASLRRRGDQAPRTGAKQARRHL